MNAYHYQMNDADLYDAFMDDVRQEAEDRENPEFADLYPADEADPDFVSVPLVNKVRAAFPENRHQAILANRLHDLPALFDSLTEALADNRLGAASVFFETIYLLGYLDGTRGSDDPDLGSKVTTFLKRLEDL